MIQRFQTNWYGVKLDPEKKPGARDTALAVLIACRKGGAWVDGALKQRIDIDRLDRRDAALATRLCYGVMQNQMLLDAWLAPFLRGKTQALVRDILRLALYQLRLMDKIPPSAAVNEAVEQAKELTNERAAGLVNAVLRSILRAPEQLVLPDTLSLRYSHPQPLVELLREAVGDDRLEALLAEDNRVLPAYVQCNGLRCTAEALTQALLQEGLQVTYHSELIDCLKVTGGKLEDTKAFREGLFYVQDPASWLAVQAAGLRPGMQMLDCCAAPGGKSFAAAIALRDSGRLISCDLHPHKIELLQKGAARLGINCLSAQQQDATQPVAPWNDAFDAVLADVPCSGLGVIRKKPDIRYKDLQQSEALPAVQLRILQTQANYVRPGGVLLYSTCTLLRRENEGVIEAFLRERSDFQAEAFTLENGVAAPQGRCTLLPGEHDTDGFFIAKLRRMA